MASIKACDVFGTTRKVERYRVAITRLPDGSTGLVEDVQSFDVDLCERALSRLIGKVEQGVTPPPKRVAEQAK